MASPRPAVVRVLCDSSGPDRTFDYLVPEERSDDVMVGSVVRVDLHGRRIGGWVIAVDPIDALELDRLLPIRKVTGRGPSADVVDLAEWSAHRWAGRRSHFLRSASPPRAVVSIPPTRYSSLRPEPRSPATTRLIARGGGVLRLPPASDVLPAIWSALAHGPTLVIVPGVDDAAVMAGRIRRAGVTVALLPDEWDRAAGGVDITVATRTGVFATLANLGCIVVVDEHDERLQSESAPTWHARDVAIERGHQAGIPVVMISPVPTPEARRTSAIEAPDRQREVAGWPHIDVVDPTDHDGPARNRVSSALLAEIRNDGRRVLCVTNTTGRSSLLACRSCRELTRCETCESVMAQTSDGDLACRRCGASRPAVCSWCGSSAFINLRPGAARFARELAHATTRSVQLVEGDAIPVWSTDGDVADVIVGTEAILHRVRSADTVVLLDIDAELFAPRFRAGQQVLGLVAKAAHVVGNRGRGGRIIIQTAHPEHRLLLALVAADPGAAGEAESATRQAFGLPPFGGFAIIEGAGAAEFASSLPTSVRVGGEGDRLQVRAESALALSDALASAVRPTRGRLRVAVEPAR
ncbi:MAG: hypothetical protein O2925_05580 [Actinomycetota bacterium]|nr:hypothetical protein [Actinomycetota bacterium]MDA3016101.1 hypothetical protein [Actinomycetota bacterium]MDA3028249.1 hypothetical protein [Actinomycetota bacterium]